MGRDKGKFNKRGGRGGGTRFQAQSAAEIEIRNARLAEFDDARSRRRAEEDDDDEDDDAAVDTNNANDEEMDAVGTKGMEGLSIGDNDNEQQQEDGEPKPMTRKEREQAEKERAAAEYRKRHEMGLTDEYKRDMAKLAEVKRRREEAAKKAAELKEMNESVEKEMKAKLEAMGANDDSSDDDDDDSSDDDKKKKKSSKKKTETKIPKLDKIAIKKMKPTQLKEALKARGLDIQGNSKALTDRLLKYEAER
jgi:hypothetical protein